MLNTTEPTEQISAAAVRAGLARVIASAPFANSPQLTNFLRFVVETTLAGQADRLKGYTIGVEALGRSGDFDPQADPIVRVEAARLRRTLARYYAGNGRDDEVVIRLEPGSYVPQFLRRVAEPAAARFTGLRQLERRWRWRLRPVLAVAMPLLLGAVIYAVIDLAFVDQWLQRRAAERPDLRSTRSATVSQALPRYGPTLQIEPLETVDTPHPGALSMANLREQLIDAFARFDDTNIVSDLPAAAQRADYRFATIVRRESDQSTSMLFRLVDAVDGTVIWSRSVGRSELNDDDTDARAQLIRRVSMPLLQPFGVIFARERLKYANAKPGDPYRCLLDSHDYLRSFDRTRHAAIRGCLERAVIADPMFASGLMQLARVYLREHQFNIAPVSDELPPLDRAFAMAERALALKPNSARAHFVLFDLQLARGDFAAAKAEAERAVALNPNDMPVLFHYGALLVLLGEVEKGEAIVRQVGGESTVPPGRLNFILFVAGYLKGDLTTADYHAKQMSGPPLSFGCLARALLGAKSGDWAAARREMQCLSATDPGWRSDPQAQLKKLFPAPAVRDRIAADFNVVVAASVN